MSTGMFLFGLYFFPPLIGVYHHFGVLEQNLRSESEAEYNLKWRHWREECMRRYEERQYTAFSQLERIVQVPILLFVFILYTELAL